MSAAPPPPAQLHPVDLSNWALKCSAEINTIKAELTTFDQPCATEDFLNSLKRINESVHNVECQKRMLKNFGAIPSLSVIPLVPGIQTHDRERTQRAKDYSKMTHWMHNRVSEYSLSALDGFNKNFLTPIRSSVETRRSPDYLRQRIGVQNDLQSLMNDVIHRNTGGDLSLVKLFTTMHTFGLLVRVGGVMNVILVFRGLLIDHLIIRGIEESVYKITCDFAPFTVSPEPAITTPNNNPSMADVDLYSASRHLVYRQLTDFARVLILKCSSNIINRNIHMLRTFLNWLKQCRNMFNVRCSKCDLHLDSNGVPPFPQLRSNEYLHDFCRS